MDKKRSVLLTISLSFSLLSSIGQAFSETADQIIELPLEELGNIKLTTVSRTSEKLTEAPATVYVFTAEDIARYGFRDLKDVLKFTPGVEYSQPGSWLQGGQRGFVGGWSQTKFLVDGRETNIIFSNESYIAEQFPLHNVERVEIIQGPASVMYGADAFVGIINIVTKRGFESTPGNTVSFQGGQVHKGIDRRRGSVFSLWKGETTAVTANFSAYGGEGPDQTSFVRTSDYSRVNVRERNFSLDNGKPYQDSDKSLNTNIEVSQKLGQNDTLTLGTYYWKQNENEGQENNELSYSDFEGRRFQSQSYATYAHQLSGTPLKFTLDYNFIYEDNDFKFPNRGDTSVFPPPLRHAEIIHNQKHRLIAQIDGKFEEIGNQIVAGASFREVNVGRFMFDDARITSIQPFERSADRSVFVQDKQNFFNELIQLTAGYRYDDNNIYGGVHTVRSGIRYAPTDEFLVRYLFGQGFLAPTIFELSANENLGPAKIDTHEVGFFYQPNKYFSAQAAIFKNEGKDIIAQERGTGGGAGGADGIPRNIGKANSEGAEALFRYKVGATTGTFWYNYVTNSSGSDTPHNKVGFSASYRFLENYTFSVISKYTTRVRTDALNQDGTKDFIYVRPYGTVDATLRADNLFKNCLTPIDVALSVYNLFDRENNFANLRGPDPIAFRDEGRSIWLHTFVHF